MLRVMAVLVMLCTVASAEAVNGDPPVIWSAKMANALPDDTKRVVVIHPEPGTFEALRRLEKLESLETSGPTIEDAEVALISGCAGLKRLVLRECTALTDEALVVLPSLQHLEALDLDGCTGLTDSGLRPLGETNTLRSLSLSGCKSMNGTGAASVRSLQSLDVSLLPLFDDTSLEALAALTDLQRLEADGTPLTGTGFGSLSQLKHLRHVALRVCESLSVDGMRALASLPALQVVVLAVAELGDAEISALADAKGLIEVDVPGTQLKVKGLRALTGLPALRELNISGCHLRVAGARVLARCKTLQTLIAADSGMNNDAMTEIAKLPDLRVLDIGDNEFIDDDGIQALAGSLTIVSLTARRLRRVRHLGVLSGMSSLTHLNVSGWMGADLELFDGIENAPCLVQVDVSGMRVCERLVRPLADLKSLRRVVASSGMLLDREMWKKFRKTRPDVDVVEKP